MCYWPNKSHDQAQSQKEGNWIKEREEIGNVNALMNTVDSIQLNVKGYQFSK